MILEKTFLFRGDHNSKIGDSEFKPVKLRLKIDLVSYPAWAEGLVNIIVEVDLKAPFSIATTSRCRGGRYSFPWIAPLYPRSLSYNTEC